MKKWLLLLSLAQLSACGMMWEYRSINDVESMTWSKTDIQHFDAEISQSGPYDVFILLRHVHGFPYANVNLNLKMQGRELNLSESFSIPVINENKEYLGDGSGDMWDIDFAAIEGQYLEAGSIDVDIQHEMSKDDLQLIMEVGIMFKRSENE